MISPDLTVVARQLREKYGAVDAHYFHAFSTIERAGGSEYLPLVNATTPDGTVLLVNSSGEVFRHGVVEPLQGATPEEKQADGDRHRQRANGKVLVYREGMAAMEKIDTLPTVR